MAISFNENQDGEHFLKQEVDNSRAEEDREGEFDDQFTFYNEESKMEMSTRGLESSFKERLE